MKYEKNSNKLWKKGTVYKDMAIGELEALYLHLSEGKLLSVVNPKTLETIYTFTMTHPHGFTGFDKTKSYWVEDSVDCEEDRQQDAEFPVSFPNMQFFLYDKGEDLKSFSDPAHVCSSNEYKDNFVVPEGKEVKIVRNGQLLTFGRDYFFYCGNIIMYPNDPTVSKIKNTVSVGDVTIDIYEDNSLKLTLTYRKI